LEHGIRDRDGGIGFDGDTGSTVGVAADVDGAADLDVDVDLVGVESGDAGDEGLDAVLEPAEVA
jgi:hypothetical protein